MLSKNDLNQRGVKREKWVFLGGWRYKHHYCIVNTILGFKDWFFYNLIALIKQCKVLYKNLEQVPLFLRNQVFCLENLTFWQAPATTEFNIFCWSFAHVFHLPMSTKGCSGFFSFCLDLMLFAKNIKDLVSTHSTK